MSALNDRFDTMQTVLPAKVFSRGVMLIILTVLSPIGLTTLYTGSADPPRNCTGRLRRRRNTENGECYREQSPNRGLSV